MLGHIIRYNCSTVEKENIALGGKITGWQRKEEREIEGERERVSERGRNLIDVKLIACFF